MGFSRTQKMEFVESFHWQKRKPYRKDVEPYMVEYAIEHAERFQRDKHHQNALNARCKIPQNGRTLKVVFRPIGRGKVKLITAYYED